MKVYNSSVLTKNQRFINAILWGSLATVVASIAYILLSSIIRGISFSIVFVAFGYFVGTAIKNKGRGVTMRFSVLAAVLVFIGILVSDIVTMFGLSNLANPDAYIAWAGVMLSTNINNLLSVLFRVFAIVTAYREARVI